MVYIITNCTNGKKVLPNEIHLFRNYNNDTIDKISSEWKMNLEKSEYKNLKARDLYKGVSWKAVLDTEKEFNIKFSTLVLIASAGYGLIDSNKIISSYGITFSRNQLDSVSRHFPNEMWWEKINEYSISKLVDASVILIYLSKEYLNAMNKYIEDLIDKYGDKVFIINVSKENNLSFSKSFLNFDTRFNKYESGTLINLGQRCLRWLSKEIVKNNLELNHNVLQEHINIFLNQYEIEVSKKGKQLSNRELEKIIDKQIQEEQVSSASKGLFMLRKNVYSCEQKRFHKLFNERKKSIYNEK
ncbi:MAG: hypothetical protein PHD79_03585 [Aliarcobacter sp.]|nr:hypothetical protein [Aliarcobacter sp.]